MKDCSSRVYLVILKTKWNTLVSKYDCCLKLLADWFIYYLSMQETLNNSSGNIKKNWQQAYLFTNVFHLVFSITRNKKNPSGEFFWGYQLYFLWGRKLKSPKISCFFTYPPNKKKYFYDSFFIFRSY